MPPNLVELVTVMRAPRQVARSAQRTRVPSPIKILLLVGTPVALVVATVAAINSDDPRSIGVPQPPGTETTPAARTDPSHRAPGAARVARQRPDEGVGFEWDRELDVLSPEARVKLLSGRINHALADDSMDAEALAAATAALTALRPELFGTPDGRARYLEYEQRVELLESRLTEAK